MTGPSPAAPARVPLVDAARGVALAAMVVYHFTWDLSFFSLIALDPTEHPGWRWFARCIAGAFLFLVGVSLTLAHARGLAARPYIFRLALVSAAALAITLVTWFAFPRSFISFGILHAIALSSVLALPFLRAHWLVIAAAAAVAVALPAAIDSPAMDSRWLAWTGLAATPPPANDFVPILPWFWLVLAGLLAGRWIAAAGPASLVRRWREDNSPSRALGWAGRRSLAIYLIHQPVLLALVWAAAQIVPANEAARARPFTESCEASCRTDGLGTADCVRFCGCVAGELRAADLWETALSRPFTPAEQETVGQIVAICR